MSPTVAGGHANAAPTVASYAGADSRSDTLRAMLSRVAKVFKSSSACSDSHYDDAQNRHDGPDQRYLEVALRLNSLLGHTTQHPYAAAQSQQRRHRHCMEESIELISNRPVVATNATPDISSPKITAMPWRNTSPSPNGINASTGSRLPNGIGSTTMMAINPTATASADRQVGPASWLSRALAWRPAAS